MSEGKPVLLQNQQLRMSDDAARHLTFQESFLFILRNVEINRTVQLLVMVPHYIVGTAIEQCSVKIVSKIIIAHFRRRSEGHSPIQN